MRALRQTNIFHLHIKVSSFVFGLPRGSVVKKSTFDARAAGNFGSISGSGRSLEKGMATHSSILAWRIPGTEEPGGFQSMGSQRVGHD